MTQRLLAITLSLIGLGAGGAAHATECSAWGAPRLDVERLEAIFYGKTHFEPNEEIDVVEEGPDGPRELTLLNFSDRPLSVGVFDTDAGWVLAFRPGVSLTAVDLKTGKSSIHRRGGLIIDEDFRPPIRLAGSLRETCYIHQGQTIFLNEAEDLALMSRDRGDRDAGKWIIITPRRGESDAPREGGEISGLFDSDRTTVSRGETGSLRDVTSGLDEAETLDDLRGPATGLGDMFKKPESKEPDIETTVLEPAPKPEEVDDAVEKALETADPVIERPPLVCYGSTGEPMELLFDVPSDPYFLLGRLSDSKNLDVFQQILPTTDVFPTEMTIGVDAAAAGKFVPISQPFGVNPVKIADETGVELTSIPDGPVRWVAPAEDGPTETGAKLDVLVISDPSRLSLSGLESYEASLIDAWGYVPWVVHWAQVQSDGSLAAPVAFESMTSLVKSVRGREGETFDPVTDVGFETLVSGLENTVSQDGPLWAKVFWLLGGQILPFEAPSRLETMLETIPKDGIGSLIRRSNGQPRPWLEVITGQFTPPEASFLIAGPVERGGGARISIGSGDGERTVLLKDYSSITERTVSFLTALQREGKIGEKRERKTMVGLPDGAIFDRRQLFEETGLVVAVNQRETINTSNQLASIGWKSVLAKKPLAGSIDANTIDMLALAQLKTSEDGTLTPQAWAPDRYAKRVRLLARNPETATQAERILSVWLPELAEQVFQASISSPDCTHIFIPDDVLRAAP